MKLQRHLIAIASATLLASGLATAQTTATTTTATPMVAPTERTVMNRDRRASMQGEKDQLKEKLSAGKTRADYTKILESNGYRIAAINADKKDYLEYEVVKGGNSYEVQLDFDKESTVATKIDVASNLWRADATKRMMKDADYKHTGALVADKDSRHSDRRYMKAWTGEKDRLEKLLPLNLKAADYRSKIEQQGYKITAVNDREKDHVEYEIAKGENSYEVQIDIDPKTGLGKKIDVTSNLWEAEATDRATDKAAARSTGATAPLATNAPLVTPSDRMVPRRDRRAAMQGDKDQLQEKLSAGKSRADYAKILESNGYRIAAINADKKDYLEYEVVKGDNSYEVQIDFDKGSAVATKVDVASNMWRADATKRMMKDADYKHTGALVAGKDSRYSDRPYMKAWTDEKERLEKVLTPNMKLADYKSKIEQQGYKITTVNDREKDYVEYEIAKGKNSYEVQIDIDPATGMGKKVDVTSNLWEAEATDKATDRKHSKR